ncbi:MAG: GAF domain-containing protein, partial [Nitrospinaceae bacterium]|nr:GAF domain-containing protein [Nitrospinaceae bacterium]NIR54087.1 GAF domain-containing protein [Nitrospinaceae bacterium]NIS84505.1 GAF domain-containing protein [Nitrospinaceae bacterium]NIT81300.1 GAF domain-containing protein [Nitrospinaceae bacterium]NIU43587.1 GAF domain-containing protein [Nitrospinaceae bacterium]
RNYITDAVPEIRIDISIRSLAGFVAATGKSLNITDAYNETELRQFHPQLSHGSTLDKILNYRTQSIMVLPLPYNRRLIGILEIINKKGTEAFSETDFKRAREISPAMGLALVKLDEQGSNGLESEPKFFSTEINTPQP